MERRIHASWSLLFAIGALLLLLGVTPVLAGGVGDDKELHRIDQVLVEQAARDAGFEIVDRSELLRNSEDDRRQSVFAPDIRGKTDRFVLRLRKPI